MHLGRAPAAVRYAESPGPPQNSRSGPLGMRSGGGSLRRVNATLGEPAPGPPLTEAAGRAEARLGYGGCSQVTASGLGNREQGHVNQCPGKTTRARLVKMPVGTEPKRVV